MVQNMAAYEPVDDQARESRERAQGRFLSGIENSVNMRGTLAQRMLCMLLMVLLTPAELPGGGYACQTAMFAVLLRLGFCVPAAFVGVLCGFAGGFFVGNMAICWQMVCCVLLWLLCGAWVRRESRMTMAAAVFAVQLSYGLFTGADSLLALATLLLTALAGAGLCVLYDGAVLTVYPDDALEVQVPVAESELGMIAVGDSVKIVGVGNVTVSDYTKNTDMGTPETLSDSVIRLFSSAQNRLDMPMRVSPFHRTAVSPLSKS